MINEILLKALDEQDINFGTLKEWKELKATEWWKRYSRVLETELIAYTTRLTTEEERYDLIKHQGAIEALTFAIEIPDKAIQQLEEEKPEKETVK